MASVFTFDPDPPRVSSPWSKPTTGGTHFATSRISNGPNRPEDDFEVLGADLLDGIPLEKLEAEPQEGPTEYKLHLLLRPRRSFSSTTTSKYPSGSLHSRSLPSSTRNLYDNPQLLAQSSGSRQHRLQQLTTQLLWRLQQSSPYHSSSMGSLILPSLPEARSKLSAPTRPAKLLPGLEGSKGALYEIGISDDGTFVGLTRDEMEESLINLRAMAASLGCSVDILRMVSVGECEWVEEVVRKGLFPSSFQTCKGKLYVAEAYIKPELQSFNDGDSNTKATSRMTHNVLDDELIEKAATKEQIRISLTGATTSGKSSLLGTLSTSTLDNGRGKSRLSLLKHRHEIASGMTSSVAQELIGYCDHGQDGVGVVNYATGNVSSWNEIHTESETGRLALLSDSAGHPRYRRTTVRGLVGWMPHWIMFCIAANDGDNTAGMSMVSDGAESFAGASAHLSMVHLDLCLRLKIPMVVIITKLDAANKTNFRQILSTVLTTLKAAGRKPIMLSNNNSPVGESDLQSIDKTDMAEVDRVVKVLENDPLSNIPVVMTSAIRGTGIGKIHGLLRRLPIPKVSVKHFESDPSILFHVDDIYNFAAKKSNEDEKQINERLHGPIISGHLSHGQIAIGDELLLGPFSHRDSESADESESALASTSKDIFLSPRSFTDALARVTTSTQVLPLEREWRRVQVFSIRNLRLPVRNLEEDHVGTIGIMSLEDENLPIRKGMILTSGNPQATHTFTASFDMGDSSSIVVGSGVVIYTASVRAPAKVMAVALSENDNIPHDFESEEERGFTFKLDEEVEHDERRQNDESILVTFKLATYREWLEIGAKIVVMPGGGQGFRAGSERGIKGVGGLEGFVGRIIERFG